MVRPYIAELYIGIPEEAHQGLFSAVFMPQIMSHQNRLWITMIFFGSPFLALTGALIVIKCAITGRSKATVTNDFSLANPKNKKKMVKLNRFWKADMRRFWYFDVSVWSGEQKLFLLGMCQNGVLAPYCRD